MPFPDRPAENADPWYDERETYDQAIEDAVTAAETKLAGIATGATANDTDANLKARANHTGTQTAATISDFDTEVGNHTDVAANTAARHTHANSAILAATTASFLVADETKLDGIATGATANATNAELRARSSHTGTQLASTISDFAATVSAVTDVVNNTAARHTHSNSAVLAATTASFLAADETKLDGIEALADVTDAANVAAAGAVMEADTTTASMSFVIDEDSFATDSATKVPTQQSVKAYVDANAGGGLSFGTGGIDMAVGEYITPDMGAINAAALASSNNIGAQTVRFAPLDVPQDMNIDALAAEVSLIAAGGTVRLGLFTYNSSTNVMTLVKDAGTIVTDSAAILAATFTSMPITAGRYWVGGIGDASALAGRLRHYSAGSSQGVVLASWATLGGGYIGLVSPTATGHAGSGFSSTYSSLTRGSTPFRIGIRKA
jgi:hypothetical protein